MTDDASLHLSDPLPEPRRYASKIDVWLALVLGAVVIVVVVSMLATDTNLWVKVLAIAPQGLVLWVLARTYYVITDVALEAHSGPFHWSIPLSAIRSLRASRNPLSSPALSTDRIAVEHAGGLLLISPRQKAAFVHAMTVAVPGLQVAGLPGADGQVPIEPESFNVGAILPAAIVVIAAFAFGGWSLYTSLHDPVVTLTPDGLAIDAYYDESLSRGEVVRIHLEDALPPTTRRQGFAAFDRLRGTFDVEGMGRTRIFASIDQPPFIVIDTTSFPLIVNFSDPARTRELYDQLLETWGLRRASGH